MMTSVEEHGILIPLIEIAQLVRRRQWTPVGFSSGPKHWLSNIRESENGTPELRDLDPVYAESAPLRDNRFANVTEIKTSIPVERLSAIVDRFVRLRGVLVYIKEEELKKDWQNFVVVINIGDDILAAKIHLFD